MSETATELKTGSGTVEYVKATALSGPDSYGNLYRLSMKVDGVWYSLSNSKRDTINVKYNGTFHSLAKGDSINFVYTERGDFKNVKTSQVNLLSVNTAPTSVETTKSVVSSDTQTRISVGHAINNATLLAIDDGNTTIDHIKERAQEILNLAEELVGEHG